MSKALITESLLTNIADAIRAKGGTSASMTPAEMATAIAALPDEAVLTTKTVTANGTYAASSDSADGYSSVTVNVSGGSLGTKSISANGTYNATDDSLDGYSAVTVAVPNSYGSGDEGKVVSSGALVAQTAYGTVTANGTYDTTTNDSITVNVSGGATLTTKTITTNGTYNASSDSADGYSQVTVNVSGGASDNDLLYHFDGDFKNYGSFPTAWQNKTSLSISDEQSKFGTYSLKFGDSQVYNNILLDMDFALSNNDFTLDFWCYPTSLTSGTTFTCPITLSYRSIGIYISDTYIQFCVAKSSSSWFDTTNRAFSFSTGAWYHIALVRDGTILHEFVNGTEVGTLDFGSSNFASISKISLGSNSYSSGDRRFSGYLSELRLKLGTAVWTTDFTPPTQAYT